MSYQIFLKYIQENPETAYAYIAAFYRMQNGTEIAKACFQSLQNNFQEKMRTNEKLPFDTMGKH